MLPVLFKDKLPKGREAEGWGAFGFITEEFAEGADIAATMQAVRKACKHVEDDCEIYC